jgi:hypothetical protein
MVRQKLKMLTHGNASNYENGSLPYPTVLIRGIRQMSDKLGETDIIYQFQGQKILLERN